MPESPAIAITLGDAAGIGPEIIVKALRTREVYRALRPVVIGSAGVLEATAQRLGLPGRVVALSSVAQARGRYGTLEVLEVGSLKPEEVTPGQLSPAAGRAAMEFVLEAVRLAQQGEVAAIVTAPINKKAALLAGYPDMGHMELFARITGTQRYATMLVSGPLRVVHLTTHHSLIQACQAVTRGAILEKLRLTDESFRGWGWERPRLGVAALNPHGGEEGLLGREEIEEIAPAVAAAREEGMDVQGPVPADSLFPQAIAGHFDAVLALYHDQGHIPIKTYGFERSVSVALGLPFIRTSVDHGTAFDIAGKGMASPQSLIEALRFAAQLIQGRLRGAAP